MSFLSPNPTVASHLTQSEIQKPYHGLKGPTRSALLLPTDLVSCPTAHTSSAHLTPANSGLLSFPNMIQPCTFPLQVFALAIPFRCLLESLSQKGLPNHRYKIVPPTCHLYSVSHFTLLCFSSSHLSPPDISHVICLMSVF